MSNNNNEEFGQAFLGWLIFAVITFLVSLHIGKENKESRFNATPYSADQGDLPF